MNVRLRMRRPEGRVELWSGIPPGGVQGRGDSLVILALDEIDAIVEVPIATYALHEIAEITIDEEGAWP